MNRSLPGLLRSMHLKNRPKSKVRSRTFEALEDRHMMAVAPVPINPTIPFLPSVNTPATQLMAGVDSGTLYIRGTDKADTITLRQVNNAITIDRLTGSFNTADFQNIIIRSFGGADTINLKSEAVKGQQAITKATKIWTGAGADEVTGGRGNDTIFTEAGNDKVWANYGDDVVDGGADDDELHGGFGYDKVFGDIGADKLWGDDNDDYLVGGDAVDYLYGGRGYDRLDGSLGYDYLYGQEDYDYLQDDSALKSDTGSNFLSNNPFVCGWFDRNMVDAALRSEARADYANNFAISRNEMMDIFRAAEDGYTIDSTEFADLEHLIDNTSVVMPDYVRGLADSIVNYDLANFEYQGTYLGGPGHLAAGDSSDKLEKLVNKWFLGLDRPVAQIPHSDGTMQNVNYQFVQGSLFQDGISYTDIHQGMVGDCYLLAALGTLAQQSPSTIRNMFIDNGDNTFTVRFYHDGVPHFVTVDRFLPIWGDGDDSSPYASFGTDKDDATNELWVALVEKAYVQLSESGWIGQNDVNSYSAITEGYSVAPMVHLTGWDARLAIATDPSTIPFTSDQIINKLNSGKLLALGSADAPAISNIVGNHAYAVVGYDATTGKFKLFNPWNNGAPGSTYPTMLDLTWSELVANFKNWSYT